MFAIVRSKRAAWQTNNHNTNIQTAPGIKQQPLSGSRYEERHIKEKIKLQDCEWPKPQGWAIIQYHGLFSFSGIMLWWSGDSVHIEDIVIHNYVVKTDDKCVVFIVMKHDKEYLKLSWVCSNISPDVVVHYNARNISMIVERVLMCMVEKSLLLYCFQTVSSSLIQQEACLSAWPPLLPSYKEYKKSIKERVYVVREDQPKREQCTIKIQSTGKCTNSTDSCSFSQCRVHFRLEEIVCLIPSVWLCCIGMWSFTGNWATWCSPQGAE